MCSHGRFIDGDAADHRSATKCAVVGHNPEFTCRRDVKRHRVVGAHHNRLSLKVRGRRVDNPAEQLNRFIGELT
ncbi:hypothetical protein BST46_26870, partial [Mycobacterium timonense]